MPAAIVWGANGGIGQALLAELGAAGWQTAAFARNITHLAGDNLHSFKADLSKPYTVQEATMSASYEIEAADLWIYAAGDINKTNVAEMTPALWQRLIEANLSGAYLAFHHSLPLLAEKAHLVFLGAYHEKLRLPGLAAYAAAKAGLEAFATTLAKEQRQRRVTIVRPGAVDTPFWAKVPLKLPPNALTAAAVAQQILTAYHEGHKGFLDL
jgi:3-oxoacyl-[acyl-carrier protein] reductase